MILQHHVTKIPHRGAESHVRIKQLQQIMRLIYIKLTGIVLTTVHHVSKQFFYLILN